MSAFGDVRADLAAKLTAGGVTGVTLDPAANPPYVLVDALTVRPPERGIGAWPAAVPVRIVHPPPGDAAALAALEEQLEAVFLTIGPCEAQPIAHPLAGDTTAPAYLLLYPIDVPNPDC